MESFISFLKEHPLLILPIAGATIAVVIGILGVIDCAFLPDLNGYGTVVGKTYYPAYVDGYINPVMRGGECNPERCGLKIDINSATGSMLVNKELWLEKRIGDEVKVTYQHHRISGYVRISRIDDLSDY